MKRFLQRLFAFSLGPVIGALISIIQIPILTRLMLPAEYGASGLFRNLMLNLPNFLYLGLDQAFSREFYIHPRKKELFQQSLLIPLGLGIVLAVFMMFFNQPIGQWLFGQDQAGTVIILAAILLISMVIERFVLLAIRMQEKAKEYSAFTILIKALIFILSLILIAIGVRDYRVVVYGMIFGQLIADAILFYRYRHFFDPRAFVWDPVLVKKLVTFGLPLVLAMSLNSILNTIDSVMLNIVSTKKELGYYQAGFVIVNVIGILKTAFATFWTPTAYRWHDEGKSMKHFKFISDALLFILTGIYFALLVFRPVIMMVLGEKFQPAQSLLGLLCFPHIMYTLSETTTLGIVFSRKTYFNILVSLLALLPSLMLHLIFTPQWGALGAAVASCGAYVAFYLARTYFSSRTGFSFKQGKHLITIVLMLLAAFLNATERPERCWGILLLGLLAFVVQFSTLKEVYSIWKRPQEWDFN